ncbi:MAG: glycosyltransferase family 4 protein [Sphaerochaetaceae bacterium]|nr:glycosyltransferase family 4 protein [Sphaerochaetaceae bacterium]
MIKYLIITPGYPSENNIYNNAFIHTRVKQYKKRGLKIVVFSLSNSKDDMYIYENVEVIEGNYKKLQKILKTNSFPKILVHFGFKKILKTIYKNSPRSKLFIWVHGVEALGWYRRFFIFDIRKPHRFFGYIFINTFQLIFLHYFIRNKKVDKTFVFVSEWMKEVMEKDSLSFGKIKKYHIIPNVVGNKLFNYVEKKEIDRYNILSIRPYNSKKYANDLSVKAILLLSKKDFFTKLNFSFYGDGKLFDKTLRPLKNFKNINIYKKFLNQEEISNIHKKHGIMLIPTRQDAQGVSMCEAMSSGLVPITSNNTAIPEYVKKNCGFLTKNYKEIAESIEELYNNSKKFILFSKRASNHIQKLCSPDEVINKEIDIISN